MAIPNDIILYGYPFSPYAQKVKAYLALRNIAYAECTQHHMLPRPDIAALGVQYRRIPIMAIGRDVYVDTRAMIRRLNQLYPASTEHPALFTPETQGIAALLANFTGNTGGIFSRAASTMSLEHGALKDPAFRADRAGMGMRVDKDWNLTVKESLASMRQAFDTLEALLYDGREWLAGTAQVSSADWEAHYVFHWFLRDLRGPKQYFNEQAYPKTFAWLARYGSTLKSAMQRSGKPTAINGSDALAAITSAEYTDTELVVDSKDPLQLVEGVEVRVWPTDGGGKGHEDSGVLVKLDKYEAAIQLKASNGKDIRLHTPRWNFRMKPTTEDKAKL